MKKVIFVLFLSTTCAAMDFHRVIFEQAVRQDFRRRNCHIDNDYQRRAHPRKFAYMYQQRVKEMKDRTPKTRK
jgi:hypothetical protein